MRIAFYSPDRHLMYDGRTPERSGIGGGVTVRIRVAEALVRRGHQVEMVCNCAGRVRHRGVSYLPLDGVGRIDADVLVMHSTGGGLDLSPVLALDIRAGVRIMAVSGIPCPKASREAAPAAIYSPSNFVRGIIAREWGLPEVPVFVTHYAAEAVPKPWRPIQREARRLIYSSHPSKGLNAAVGVLRVLRASDPRFELHVAGGNRLWGGEDRGGPSEEGVVYHGMISQQVLARHYAASSFAMHLQTRLEPFALTPLEAMAAGCIVLASPVGGYGELVRHGWNGFLIEGDPDDVSTGRRTAGVILDLLRNPSLSEFVRRNAIHTPLTWDQVAEVWEAHWRILLNQGEPAVPVNWAACRECSATSMLLMADGYHCAACGCYSPSL